MGIISVLHKSHSYSFAIFSHYFNILCQQVPAEDLKVKNIAKHYNPQEAQADVTFSEKVCRKQSSFMSEDAFSCPHSLSGSRILGYKTLLHFLLVFRAAAEECVLLSFLFLCSWAFFFHLGALRIFSFSCTQDSQLLCLVWRVFNSFYLIFSKPIQFGYAFFTSGKYHILPLLISYSSLSLFYLFNILFFLYFRKFSWFILKLWLNFIFTIISLFPGVLFKIAALLRYNAKTVKFILKEYNSVV